MMEEIDYKKLKKKMKAERDKIRKRNKKRSKKMKKIYGPFTEKKILNNIKKHPKKTPYMLLSSFSNVFDPCINLYDIPSKWYVPKVDGDNVLLNILKPCNPKNKDIHNIRCHFLVKKNSVEEAEIKSYFTRNVYDSDFDYYLTTVNMDRVAFAKNTNKENESDDGDDDNKPILAPKLYGCYVNPYLKIKIEKGYKLYAVQLPYEYFIDFINDIYKTKSINTNLMYLTTFSSHSIQILDKKNKVIGFIINDM